ncbi:MAG: hypothetical protein KDB48_02335 [Solirubrobacterales bacterium]|nr:hypothetical protein [Solirubrobacterales bacterium]HMT06341.1 hypothetical protein [Solirubrobacterales bacterium]
MNGRLAAITALLGALIVIISQVVTAYSLENELGEVLETVTLLSKHGALTAIIGLASAIALVFAVATGSRSALIVMVGLGVAVIMIFLIVDVPDIGSTGMFNTPTAGNIDATGKAEAGLWLELIGGVIIVLAGLALFSLDPDQLRSIGPQTANDTGREERRSGRKSDSSRASVSSGRITRSSKED